MYLIVIYCCDGDFLSDSCNMKVRDEQFNKNSAFQRKYCIFGCVKLVFVGKSNVLGLFQL